MVTHRSLVNLAADMQKRLCCGSKDRLLALTTISFDIAGLELYVPLIAGACIALTDKTTTADPGRLYRDMELHGVTLMQATPTSWRMLLDGGWQGREGLKALCGGEALDKVLAHQLQSRVGTLWNVYGPTETTIWSTAAQVKHNDESMNGVEAIGSPIANTRTYILDESCQPVPIGVAGELYIGGDGVARGYLNREELTAERFVRDPFSDEPDARMYKTGDLGRWRPDGALEYLGRNDFQVKIRGQRIELGEIEARLVELPAGRGKRWCWHGRTARETSGWWRTG